MNLPTLNANSKATTVAERRVELTEIRDNPYLSIVSYAQYSEMPEIKPLDSRPENIFFYPDGLEALISSEPSRRVIVTNAGKVTMKIDESPVNKRYTFVLVDEVNKKILTYTIDDADVSKIMS